MASNRPGDPGWEAALDGEVIARGGALGIVTAELAVALEKQGLSPTIAMLDLRRARDELAERG